MIKEVIMYTVICDNCQKDVNENQEYSCYNDEMNANDIAMESNWIKCGDKHYCADCYEYDDNDELSIKE